MGAVAILRVCDYVGICFCIEQTGNEGLLKQNDVLESLPGPPKISVPSTSTPPTAEDLLAKQDLTTVNDTSPISSPLSQPPLDVERIIARRGENGTFVLARDLEVEQDPEQAPRAVVEENVDTKESVGAEGLLERQRMERVSVLTRLVVDTAAEVLRVRISFPTRNPSRQWVSVFSLCSSLRIHSVFSPSLYLPAGLPVFAHARLGFVNMEFSSPFPDPTS